PAAPARRAGPPPRAPAPGTPPGTDPTPAAPAGSVRAARRRRVRGPADAHRGRRTAAGLPVMVRGALAPSRSGGQPGSRRPSAGLPGPAGTARPRGRERPGPGMDGIAERATAVPARRPDAAGHALATEPAAARRAAAVHAAAGQATAGHAAAGH